MHDLAVSSSKAFSSSNDTISERDTSTILTSPQTGATEHSSLLNDAEVDHTPNNAYSNVSVTIITSLEGQHDIESHSER